ncbi:DUF4870 domain-containing protein [Staphylococcus simiae]|uniref:DUF4870 domain-containing protein n=1 Tax=Staphylococcus simiae TaxID=308354 RepID=UPI001A99F035|nr:DUF4870 domain-containing protein [Staphylococcus simiae]MBO1198287.1 DUF4870 domain-containing protein [Staphylococcus simiae]MBO1201978.1 DUF4870 domain-containing protein [Staphylococcus simiae]MBO1204190.1 DUF4870 domain-containing protein [Staphylococcus simiae]MBO1210279.1 DUF4870 domain-containing protein [Staphylococcus simiae]MBO1230424.1 DUF4870 domain-containing protein [Staphylococcus simiae]
MNFQNQSKNPNAFQYVSQNEKNMAMLIWLLSIFTSFVGPLVIWLIKKEESEFVNQQGKNFLNYAISYSIYLIASLVLTIVLIGYIPLFILSIAGFVYTIMAIVTVNKGQDFVVPLSIEIIK